MPFSSVTFCGRWDLQGIPRVCAPAAEFSFAFEGASLALELEGEARFRIEIDGKDFSILETRERKIYPVAADLENGIHEARVRKMTETEFGSISLWKIYPEPIPQKTKTFPLKMEFIGDSYTVGFGNSAPNPITGTAFSTTDATRSYAALVAEKFHADFQVNAYSGRGLVQNYMQIAPRWTIPQLYLYTLGGESPLGNSPSWDFSAFHPDILCLFIGINDWQGEGSHPNPAIFDAAYSDFLDFIRSKHQLSHIFLLSTDIFPQNFLSERIESVFSRELSRGNRDISHIYLPTPQNSGLDFHPNLSRHEAMANKLFQKINTHFEQKKCI